MDIWRYGEAIALGEMAYFCARLYHRSGQLVALDQKGRVLRRSFLPPAQVGAANAAGFHFEDQPLGICTRIGRIAKFDGLGTDQACRSHLEVVTGLDFEGFSPESSRSPTAPPGWMMANRSCV